MGILDLFVIPADVVLTPVSDLDTEVAALFDSRPGDLGIARPATRGVTTIIDPDTAALIEFFREPTTIVDGVLAYCRRTGADPGTVLETSYPALTTLRAEGILVPAASASAEPIAASLPAGTPIGAGTVVASVKVLADTEVYRIHMPGRRGAALKIAGAVATAAVEAGLAHEARILGLAVPSTPTLLAHDVLERRRYLVMEWCYGGDLFEAAAVARRLGSRAAPELLDLAARVLDAYADLHEHGILHGDVHPRNVLVGPSNEITVLDFGLAAAPAHAMRSPLRRGGIDLYHEPELALALLAGAPEPPLTEVGEQYSIAALLYFVLTGAHTHDFSMEKTRMLTQLTEQPPQPFARRGADALVAVEPCLRRALSHHPGDRYRSTRDFATDFQAALASHHALPPRRDPRELTAVVDHVRAGLEPAGDQVPHLEPPTASLTYGAAGRAYALLLLAESRHDEELLARADVWITRAHNDIDARAAFFNDDTGITADVVGHCSLFHHVCGVHFVRALIAQARGDTAAADRAVHDYIQAAATVGHDDVAFGRAGILLGCAHLLTRIHDDSASALRALGDHLYRRLLTLIEPGSSPLDADGTSLGIAHGLAGILYAILHWAHACELRPPAGALRHHLDELAALAVPAGRGLHWPLRRGEPAIDGPLTASWCNGSAGHVFLWLQAHRAFDDAHYALLARLAGWTCLSPPPGTATDDLCCGTAGRCYALLALAAATGEYAWLDRARALADELTRRPLRLPTPTSLYHGEPGLAVLATHLTDPAYAYMPVFQTL
ncbi:lanthionine synthetase LanC family protein [Nocardia beijingensis]|uniref:lanthionine synthetase LanC family protein n=1 Tax=Nocardia beijingensis TaxID=95162 RepID=UPI000833F9C0|nr:lanthionine synthetase LanC family protein [Nocardia beijingensis]